MLRGCCRLVEVFRAPARQCVRFKSAGADQVAPATAKPRGRPRKVKDDGAPESRKSFRRGGRSPAKKSGDGWRSLLAFDSAMTKKILSEQAQSIEPVSNGEDVTPEENANANMKIAKPAKNKIASASPTRAKKKKKPKSADEAGFPPRVQATITSKKHHDLESYETYAEETKLNKESTVYKGTRYEYIVGDALASLNFILQHHGRSSDRGSDFIGHWNLPAHTKEQLRELRVLVQCKAYKATPSMIRELEGSYAGAPAGWRGDNVLALLVSNKETTRGVNDAIQRSERPTAVMVIDDTGFLIQFIWNATAAQAGLEGIGVAVKRSPVGRKEGLALVWEDKIWPDHKVNEDI